METYYTVLGVARDADAAAIELAYQQQRERYRTERVAALDDEIGQVARDRSAALDHAYATLADPARRAAYDQRLRGGTPAKTRATVSRRELVMLIGGALIGLLVIAAVWNFAGRSTTPGVTLAQLNRPAPVFTLPALDGGDLQLQNYIGKKTVLINFWYSECAPCQEETPALQQVYKKLAADGLVVIGVNVRGNERRGALGDEDIRKFIARYNVTYPIAIDTQGDTGRAYQVTPLPSSYFIDTSGTIRYAAFQTVTAEDVERVFKELQRGATAAR